MRPFWLLSLLLLTGCAAPEPEPEVASERIQAPKPPQTDELAPKGPTNVQTVTYNGVLGIMPMDLVRPSPRKNLHRAILLIHGGGWVGGTRKDMGNIAQALAEDGFLGVPIEYTLVRQGIWPKQLQDVQAAVRYVRRHARELDVDPKWIGAAGVSAGGHLSLWLGAVDAPLEGISSRVQAVGSISGIHDLNAPLTPEGDRYRIVEALLGENGRRNDEARRRASPINVLAADSAPAMFIQGDMDELVPRSQSDSAAAKLKSYGVETRVRMVKGMHHGLVAGRAEDRKALEELAAWLRRHLKAGSK